MRRFILITLFLSILSTTFGSLVIPLAPGPIDHEGGTKGRRMPALLPVCYLENGQFTIYSPYQLDDVEIILRDESNEIIFEEQVSAVSDYYSFVVSEDICNETYSLELTYGDDIHLFGFLY